ncbi:MAG: HD domain-containing protein [Treponema sp.]|nr:HD domain-containing protein [Treponema sp.]
MKKSFLTFVFILLAFKCFAQKYQADPFFADYVMRSWSAEDGLPGNAITDIVQNDDGYIFIGTYGGLVRFDGVEFITLNKFTDEKYDFLSARSIIEDSRGNLWIGSNDEGVVCILKDGGSKHFSVDEGLPNNSIRDMCEDFDGNIWIGTASGIACISKDYEVFKPRGFETIPDGNMFIVSQLYCDTAGRIWIVTRREKGLYVYSDQEFSVYDGIHCIENPVVTTVSQEASGAFWFGLAPYYAVKISPTEENLHVIGHGEQKGTVVTCIYQDSAKNLWFALDNGITIFHDGVYSYLDRATGLVDQSIISIIEDKEKNIWIATDCGGVEKISYSKFQTTSMSTTINAIAQDTFRNVVWLAGDDGLYCYRNGLLVENSITRLCKNIRIRHVSLTKDGALLVSTYAKYGQLKIDLNGNVTSWTKEKGLAGNRVRVAEEMSNGDIYVGTTNGLSIIHKKDGTITNITKGDKLINDYIMCLYEDAEGSVWVGTDGGGVFVIKNEKIILTLNKESGLAGNVIFKISPLRKNELWICTGSGASCIKQGKIYSFDSANGFGTDGIFQLLPDYTQKVWGTSNSGLFNITVEDIDAIIEGRKTKINAKFYNKLDGITSGGVTSTSLSMRDDLGRMWFTLIDGFTIFDPVRNASNSSAPVIKIQKVFVDSVDTEIKNDKIILAPNVKRVLIKYTGISFISSEQVRFKTKLEGFENDYSEWTDTRFVSYTNLKPGTYTFYVIAENGDEVINETPAMITIVKRPYVWQEWWFIILCVLLISGIITSITLHKINSYKKEQEKTERLSIEITQALAGTIDAKDKYTNGHSSRVAIYARMLSATLGDSEEYQKKVYYAALLHDIGKIGVPDRIINKPGKLTEKEYDVVKQHPVIGSQILSSISGMDEISVGARSHHEHYNGKGYPDKLKGEEIPRIARLIGVADAYDAMTSNRSYRHYMQQNEVREEFVKNRGTQFDPEIADCMISIIDKDTTYALHE